MGTRNILICRATCTYASMHTARWCCVDILWIPLYVKSVDIAGDYFSLSSKNVRLQSNKPKFTIFGIHTDVTTPRCDYLSLILQLLSYCGLDSHMLL